MKRARKIKARGKKSQEIESSEPRENVYYSASHTCLIKGPFPIEYGTKTTKAKEDAEECLQTMSSLNAPNSHKNGP